MRKVNGATGGREYERREGANERREGGNKRRERGNKRERGDKRLGREQATGGRGQEMGEGTREGERLRRVRKAGDGRGGVGEWARQELGVNDSRRKRGEKVCVCALTRARSSVYW